MSEDVDLDQLRKLVVLAEKHNLAELTVEEDGTIVTVKCGSAPTSGQLQAASAQSVDCSCATLAPESPATGNAAPSGDAARDAKTVRIGAPMIGVYYRASSPDTPPFIEVGDDIEVGQTIGLIEAMKVFSEIPSEVAGTVVEIPVANGKLVQQGDTIVIVRVD